MSPVISGLEKLASSRGFALQGMRAGLLTNPCGVDRSMRSSIDVINGLEFVDLVALFAPEHGIRGEVQAGANVGSDRDSATNLPIHSLYGNTRTPTEEMLDDVDILIVDLQDIGVRHTTYLSTLHNVLASCIKHETRVVILDRPNPLGGITVQGGLLAPDFRSFVGTHTIPTVHGMTLGELGLMLAHEHCYDPPTVIEMDGWQRSMRWNDTGLPWIQPSPNLPTLDSVIAYPGSCLIEGTVLSEGRGTTRPFEMIGAPWVDPTRLADAMNALMLPGIRVRSIYFVPSFSKHAGLRCGGIQTYVDDEKHPNMVEFGVHLLHTLKFLYPEEFAWVDQPEDSNHHFIDLLTGSADVRGLIEAGIEPRELFDRWVQESTQFRNRRQPFLQYDSDR